ASLMRCAGVLCLAVTSSQTALAQPREYDIVIYGGTAGGVAAAVQGARMGKAVVLIEPGRHIGGATSRGLRGAPYRHQARHRGNVPRILPPARHALRRRQVVEVPEARRL